MNKLNSEKLIPGRENIKTGDTIQHFPYQGVDMFFICCVHYEISQNLILQL